MGGGGEIGRGPSSRSRNTQEQQRGSGNVNRSQAAGCMERHGGSGAPLLTASVAACACALARLVERLDREVARRFVRGSGDSTRAASSSLETAAAITN